MNTLRIYLTTFATILLGPTTQALSIKNDILQEIARILETLH